MTMMLMITTIIIIGGGNETCIAMQGGISNNPDILFVNTSVPKRNHTKIRQKKKSFVRGRTRALPVCVKRDY